MSGSLDVLVSPGRPPIATAGLSGNADPVDWIGDRKDELDGIVEKNGAVLIRGLGVRDAETAARVSRAAANRLMTEYESFAPRESLGGGVYSANAWPPDQPMCMHNELSYALEFPGRQIFCCLTAPATGGGTALADGMAMLADIPAELLARLDRHGWELVRNYNAVIGVSWQDAFDTTDREAVEWYCAANDIQWSWEAGEWLTTRRTMSATAVHPVTGERSWFNQLAFLNEWTMDPAIREYLVYEFGPSGLPFTTFSGDGEPFDRRTVDLINDIYAEHTVGEPWQPGDVLVVDNIRMAHSRDPYTGPREIVVALADPVRRESRRSDVCHVVG